MRNKKEAGITIVETIIYTAIMVIVVSMTFQAFSSFRDNQAIEKSASQMVTALRRAQTMTTSSKNASQYGVYFLSNKVIVFRGVQYSSSGSENESFSFDPAVSLGTTTFNGGGSSIVFKRITGATDNFGTSTVYLKNNISKFRSIFVNPSGFVQY